MAAAIFGTMGGLKTSDFVDKEVVWCIRMGYKSLWLRNGRLPDGTEQKRWDKGWCTADTHEPNGWSVLHEAALLMPTESMMKALYPLHHGAADNLVWRDASVADNFAISVASV